MLRLVPIQMPPIWLRIGVGLAASAIAWLLRAALGHWLYDQTPYATFFAAVLFSSLVGGGAGGATATLAGGFLANISFVRPFGHLSIADAGLWGLIVYLFVAACIALACSAVGASLRREAALAAKLKTVSEEYRHRIKNLLFVTQSLVRQAGAAPSTEEFQNILLGRLKALAKAQDRVLEHGGGPLLFQELLEETLEPFSVERRLTQALAGPAVKVSSDAAVAIALLVNELATNSVKYGALSVPHGRLRLNWSEGPEVLFQWKEMDGPAVTPPEKLGFGSRLFRRTLSPDCGKADIVFEPDGVRCEVRIRAASP